MFVILNIKNARAILVKLGISILGIYVNLNTSVVANENEDSYLEEVMVTARFREESAQDIGQSITALSGDQIRDRGIKDFSDLVAHTPGLSAMDRGPGRSTPSIRGISQATGPLDILQQGVTVSQFYDEVPTVSLTASQFGVPLYDISRVEVLKGPQPTYFGEGAVGGSIRYFSKDPNLDTLGGAIRAGISSFDNNSGLNYVLNGAVELPIVEDKFGVRLKAWTRRDEGFIDNLTTGQDDVNEVEASGFGAVFLANPSNNLDWRLSILTQDLESHADQVVDGNVGKLHVGSAQPQVMNAKTSDETLVVSNKIGIDLEVIRLESVLGYFDRELIRNYVDRRQSFFVLPVLFGVPGPVTANIYTTDENYSHDLRFITNFEGPLNFTAGYYYADSSTRIVQDFRADTLTPLPGSGSNFYFDADFDAQSEQHAMYGEVQLSLLEQRLRLAGGVRHVDIEQDTSAAGEILLPVLYDANGLPIFFTVLDTLQLGASPEVTLDISEILPRGLIEYDINDSTLLYVSAAKGIRNGNLNSPAVVALGGLSQEFSTYGPDTTWSYEVGIKSNWLNGRLLFNTAVSFSEWEDIQTYFEVAGFNIADNGPNADIFNFETFLNYHVSKAFSLYASADYTEAEFSDNLVLAEPPTPTSPDIADGDELPLVPRYKVVAGAEYRFVNAFDFLDLVVHIDAQHRSKMVNAAQDQRPIKDLSLLNLRVGFESESWSVQLYVNNVTNEIETVYDGTLFLGELALLSESNTNRPRTVGVNFYFNF